MKTELQLRADICEVGRRLWHRGLISGAEGNISARLDPDLLLTTPSGCCKGFLEPNDIVLIDMNGEPVSGEALPSSEIKVHLAAYRERSDCQAVVHAHPPCATGFSVAGAPIPDHVLPEAVVVLGPVPIVDFVMPGTQELADKLRPVFTDHKTMILSHHGALTLGKDLFDALYRMESLENVCEILKTAQILGKVRPMPKDAFDMLQKTALNGRLD